MTYRALFSLIPLAALVGCSWFHRDSDDRSPPSDKSAGSTYRCTERDKCRVKITVTACSATGITASPNTLKVAKNLKEVTIVWKLDAPAGFAFATDGVNFKNKELASRQFRVARAAGSDEFRWEDANTAAGRFPYNVKVTHNGRDCPILDPTVINDDVTPP